MTRRANTTFAALSALVALSLAATGCLVTVDDELTPGIAVHVDIDARPLLADLQVDWTIDGSDAPALCSIYGVQRWEVTLHGPEIRQTMVDCRDNWWSSENDFTALRAGEYRVTVRALDGYDNLVASVATSVGLYDSAPERLKIDFDSGAF